MKPCRSYQPRLVLLASGDADAPETAALRRHCSQCPACAAYLEEISGLCDGLRQETAEVPLADQRFHRSWMSRIAPEDRAIPIRQSEEGLLRSFNQAWSWVWTGGFAVVLGAVAWLAMENRRAPSGAVTIAVPTVARNDESDARLMASSTVSAQSYRAAVRHSNEAFEQLLARNAQEMASENQLIHAFRGRRLEIAE